MKALVYEGVETLSLRDVPDPIAGKGEVVVEIQASGICGSDMHAYMGHDARRPAPLILGHEAAGVVRGDGPMAGKRVTINPLVTCQECDVCQRGQTNLCQSRQIISMMPREGAFTEQVAIPMRNLVEVPEGISFAQAALAEPLACGWHAVRLAFENSPVAAAHASCLVIGGGAIGFGAALALRAFGVQDITLIEPMEARRENLAQYCDFRLLPVNPDDTALHGTMDIIIDGVGYAQTRADACAFAKPGASIAHIGLGSGEGGLDVRKMTLQEIRFIGTYTYTMADFQATAAAIFDGRLGALDWPELRTLDQGVQAFKDLRAAEVMAPKIILTP